MSAEPETPDPDTLILRKALEPYFTKNACRATIDKIIIFHARKIASKAWNNGHEIALNAMLRERCDEITRLRGLRYGDLEADAKDYRADCEAARGSADDC